MKLILSKNASPDLNHSDSFTCFEIKKKNSLSDPFTLTRTEIIQQLNDGEDFHTIYRVDCRWEIGDPIRSY